MAKKQIYGNYIIQSNLTANFPIYKFTGNNRNAYISPNNQNVNFNCNSVGSNDSIYFITQNKIYIKRARLLTPGCEKLRAGLNSKAAALVFSAIEKEGVLGNHNSFTLAFTRFNEWENFNFFYEPYKSKSFGKILKTEECSFRLDLPPSYVSIDDYNIQSAYIGQPISLWLEMEIDTNGLKTSLGEIV